MESSPDPPSPILPQRFLFSQGGPWGTSCPLVRWEGQCARGGCLTLPPKGQEVSDTKLGTKTRASGKRVPGPRGHMSRGTGEQPEGVGSV